MKRTRDEGIPAAQMESAWQALEMALTQMLGREVRREERVTRVKFCLQCGASLEGIAQRRTRLYCSRACVERAWWARHKADGTLPKRDRRKGLTGRE